MSYLLKNIPKNTKDVLDTVAQDKVITTVKNAIHKYIDSFLNTQGVKRSIAEALGTHTLQFITDAQVIESKGDKKLALEILTDSTIEKLPCVLITDSAFEWVPSGLNHQDSESSEGASVIKSFTFIFELDIKILIATHDEASTKDLTSLICLMLGPLQNIAGGSLIKNKESNWVVKLPMIFPAPVFSSKDVEGSQTDKIWIGEINVPHVHYENTTMLNLSQEIVTSIESGVADNVYKTPELLLNNVPDAHSSTTNITVGTEYRFAFRYLEEKDKILIDQRPIVLNWQQPNETNIIGTPINQGSFEISIVSGDKVKYKKTIHCKL